MWHDNLAVNWALEVVQSIADSQKYAAGACSTQWINQSLLIRSTALPLTSLLVESSAKQVHAWQTRDPSWCRRKTSSRVLRIDVWMIWIVKLQLAGPAKQPKYWVFLNTWIYCSHMEVMTASTVARFALLRRILSAINYASPNVCERRLLTAYFICADHGHLLCYKGSQSYKDHTCSSEMQNAVRNNHQCLHLFQLNLVKQVHSVYALLSFDLILKQKSAEVQVFFF